MPWRCLSTYWQLIHEYFPAFSVLGSPCCILYAAETCVFAIRSNLIHPSFLRPSSSSLPMHVPLHCSPWKSVLAHSCNMAKITQSTLLNSLDYSLAKRQSIVDFLVPYSIPTCDSYFPHNLWLIKFPFVLHSLIVFATLCRCSRLSVDPIVASVFSLRERCEASVYNFLQ